MGRALIFVSLLALAGCGSRSTQDEAVVANSGNSAAASTGTVNGVAEVGEAAPVPRDGELLAGIPAYPNADGEVRAAGASQQGGGIQTFRTRDSAGMVARFYAEAAERAGFTVADQTDMGHTSGVTARRGAGELLNVTATRVGAVTEVQVIAARPAG